MRVPHRWSPSCLPPVSGKSKAHAEPRSEARVGLGWARAMLSVAGSPTSQKRIKSFVARNPSKYWGRIGGGATSGRWNFFDGEQRGLCTVTLSPR